MPLPLRYVSKIQTDGQGKQEKSLHMYVSVTVSSVKPPCCALELISSDRKSRLVDLQNTLRKKYCGRWLLWFWLPSECIVSVTCIKTIAACGYLISSKPFSFQIILLLSLMYQLAVLCRSKPIPLQFYKFGFYRVWVVPNCLTHQVWCTSVWLADIDCLVLEWQFLHLISLLMAFASKFTARLNL